MLISIEVSLCLGRGHVKNITTISQQWKDWNMVSKGNLNFELPFSWYSASFKSWRGNACHESRNVAE